MSAPDSFVATSSVTGLVPVLMGGRPLMMDAPRVLALLNDRVPGLADLFAAPLLTKAAPGPAGGSVSWYGVHDHPARLLREAQPIQHEQAVAELADRLRRALVMADDPDLGHLLPGLLTIPALDSVMVAGRHPVLINWGYGPPGLDGSAEGLRAHFDSLFGPLCGVTWPAPPQPVPTMGAAGLGAAGAAAVGPAASAAQPAPPTEPPPPPPQADSSASPASTTDPAGFSAAAGPATVAAAPWYASRPLVIGLGVLLGLLILALLWWLLWAPGGLLRPASDGSASDLNGPVLHDPVLDGLRRERDRLQGLQGLACGPDLEGALREGFTRPLPPHSTPPDAATEGPVTLPPAPDLSALPAAPASRMTALARALEYAAALVVTQSQTEVGMGTAFFISKDTLVTNRHVVEDGGAILVTSQAMGGTRPARLIASTNSSDIGSPDFAILRLDAPVETALPLAVATRVDKLSRVVTAGFPGYITGTDAAFSDLQEGRMTAAPSMVFTSGEVNVVQRQPSGTTIVIHTADMSQGNSGGPLVDLCGRVVGVNTFIGIDEDSGRRGLYALSGGDLLAFLAASGIAASGATDACAEGGEAEPAPTPAPAPADTPGDTPTETPADTGQGT